MNLSQILDCHSGITVAMTEDRGLNYLEHLAVQVPVVVIMSKDYGNENLRLQSQCGMPKPASG